MDPEWKSIISLGYTQLSGGVLVKLYDLKMEWNISWNATVNNMNFPICSLNKVKMPRNLQSVWYFLFKNID